MEAGSQRSTIAADRGVSGRPLAQSEAAPLEEYADVHRDCSSSGRSRVNIFGEAIVHVSKIYWLARKPDGCNCNKYKGRLRSIAMYNMDIYSQQDSPDDGEHGSQNTRRRVPGGRVESDQHRIGALRGVPLPSFHSDAIRPDRQELEIFVQGVPSGLHAALRTVLDILGLTAARRLFAGE